MAQGAPALSIVIATTQPWPEVATVLDSVHEQAIRSGAEIIVADGSGCGRPSDHRYPGVRWLEERGAAPTALRALGQSEARGSIVAVTEDHCRVAPDWCRRIIESHSEHPAADIIGGCVDNGARERLIDWASFLISGDRFLPPMPIGEQRAITGQANVSYKRRGLPDPYPRAGLDEGRFRNEVRRHGGHLFSDGRIRVSHVQSLGILGSCVVHFHDGRTLAGTQRVHLSALRWFGRLAKELALPLRVFLNPFRIAIRTAIGKPKYRRPALASIPWMALILTFHHAGELVGHLTGPGASPERLR